MARELVALALLALWLGCPKSGQPEDSTALASQVQGTLAERERKITSYRYDGMTEQAGQPVQFAFSYRTPSKMRAELKSQQMTFAFDGQKFYQWAAEKKVLTVVDLAGAPREKATEFLHRVFSPFAPEGWRTPLLAGKLEARSREEGGAKLIDVTASAEDVAITYTFAPPAMDFVAKKVKDGGGTRVTEKHCELELKLCLPQVVVEEVPGAPKAVTTLSNISINVPLAPEVFELKAPEGATVESRGLE